MAKDDSSLEGIEGRYPNLAQEVRRMLGWYGAGPRITSRLASRRSDVSHTTINSMLAGDRPSMEMVIKFAEGMGIDPNILLRAANYPELARREGETEPPAPPYQKMLEWIPDTWLDNIRLEQVDLQDMEHVRSQFFKTLNLPYVPEIIIKQSIDMFIEAYENEDPSTIEISKYCRYIFNRSINIVRSKDDLGINYFKQDFEREKAVTYVYAECVALALFGWHQRLVNPQIWPEQTELLRMFCYHTTVGATVSDFRITPVYSEHFLYLITHAARSSYLFLPFKLQTYNESLDWQQIVDDSVAKVTQKSTLELSSELLFASDILWGLIELMRFETNHNPMTIPYYYIGMVNALMAWIVYSNRGSTIHEAD